MVTNSCCGGAVPITDVLWSMNCLFLSSCYLKDVLEILRDCVVSYFGYLLRALCLQNENYLLV